MSPEQFAEARERHETEILGDPGIQALAYCPQIQRSAVWIFGIWKCLEQLAKLPGGQDTVSGIGKETRLRMWVKSLFLFLSTPGEAAFLRGHEHPKEALAHNEQASPVTVGPIVAESIAEGLVTMARSVMYSLHVAQDSNAIPSVKRITSITVGHLEPLIQSEGHDRVMQWLDTELDPVLLTSLFGRLQTEFRDAGRIVSGVSLERELEVHRRQGELIKVLEPVDKLREIAQHILLALYRLREKGKPEPIQSAVTAEIGLIWSELERTQTLCSRSNYTSRLRGLARLRFIEGSKNSHARLTPKGIQWVRDSGLVQNSGSNEE